MAMNFPSPIATDPTPVPSPSLWGGSDRTLFDIEEDSYRRAMPIQRLLNGGMRYADAIAIHGAGAAGIAWADCGEWLGKRNLRLARHAQSRQTARLCFRFASACFRFAHCAFASDTDRKRSLIRKMVDSFSEAGALDSPPIHRHEISWSSGKLCGWLILPSGVEAPPVVIVMGGFDGWREEYYSGAVALAERGVAAFLVDGPGQGESRLFHGIYLDVDFPEAFLAIATYLREQDTLGSKVGIWGNSLGGFLAAKTVAAHNKAFGALCVNGGTMRPLELPERYPRFFEKVEALIGTTDRARVMDIMKQFDLSQDVQAIECPLLQLHSVPDQVFLLENARPIYDRAASADKTLLVWEDGDHCIYNHFDEKNACVADWFAVRLQSLASPPRQYSYRSLE